VTEAEFIEEFERLYLSQHDWNAIHNRVFGLRIPMSLARGIMDILRKRKAER
jgi:hypothetical protein